MSRAGTIAAIVLSAVMTPAIAWAQGNGNGRANSREQMRFRAMDTDNDGVITRAEWTGDDQSFREHDLNHDGVLSGDEVSPRAVTDGSDRSRREEMAARFERADRNGDGEIARSEWTGTTAAFKRMDQDGDGLITGDEYFQVMQTVGTSGSANATASQNAAASQKTTRAYRAGYDKGQNEGREAGKEDKNVNGGHWDLEGQRELEQADSGYTQDLGARTDYQAGYRAGFRLGYREGFGPRR
jgi:Ca2+-binding EF-hand superfamily protein